MPKLFPKRPKTLKERSDANVKDMPTAFHPKIDFAFKHDMITPEERDACLVNDMCIEGPYLTNLNTTTPSFPTGTHVKIYKGRRWDVEAARLLGLRCKT